MILSSIHQESAKIIMFTDIVDSTSMKAIVGGDLPYLKRILFPHHIVIREQFQQHGGCDIKITRNGFLLVFDSLSDAITYASNFQDYLAGLDIDPISSVKSRVGIHLGYVASDRDGTQIDIAGSDVDYSSRICDIANGGQVLFSSAAANEIQSTEARLYEWEGYLIKGFDGIHSVFELLWGDRQPKRPSGKTRRVCERLLNLLRPTNYSLQGGDSRYIRIQYRSDKFNCVWEYEVNSAAKCGELAEALGEQHFSPFHKTFEWILLDESGNECDKDASLIDAGLMDNCTVSLIMKSSPPILDPAYRHPSPSFYASHELECSGDFLRSIEALREIVENHPNDIIALNDLAWAYLEANQNIEEAERLLRTCVQRNPSCIEEGYIRDTMGWLEYRKGNYAVAENHLLSSHDCISRNSNPFGYVATLYHLYFVWQSLGKDEKAQLAREELLTWCSQYGAIRLFVKRVATNDDSYLIQPCQWFGEPWNRQLRFRLNRPLSRYRD